MSPAQVERVESECWNCDRTVAQVVKAKLELSSGWSSVVSLCQPCFVTVYLPLVAEAHDLMPDAGHTRSLLVVDDDPSILGLLKTIFEREGFSVNTATNGLEALEKARTVEPDAIVLDLCMPVMNGHEFLHAWRQTTPQTTVPVVAISAYGISQTAEDLGVEAFLPKPFDMLALLDTVAAMVDPQRSAGLA
jgi:CheY-like chemotaxis protein